MWVLPDAGMRGFSWAISRARACSSAVQNDGFTMKMTISDTVEVYRVFRRDGILLYYKGNENPEADFTVTCARLQLLALMNGDTDIIEKMQVEGDATVLTRMVKYITPIIHNFNIIEP